MNIEDAYIELQKSNKLRQKTIIKLSKDNAKLKEELAEANQLKDMYHTYYRAKHDDIKGIIFKQKEKLEKIKDIVEELMNVFIEGAEDDK